MNLQWNKSVSITGAVNEDDKREVSVICIIYNRQSISTLLDDFIYRL